MKEDSEKIRGKVKKLKDTYNFRGPLHFTDFSNLNSIISIGYLCSRNLCYANNIEFHDALDEEAIENISSKVRDYTRLYYVGKNNHEAMQHINIPVYLLFDEELLYLDLAAYTNGSADFMDTDFGMDFDFFNYEIDWDIVFSNRNTSECLNGAVKELFCRRKQSELLIDEPVPLRHLKNIIFRCNADYKRACSLFGKNKMFVVEPEMFINFNNYVKDYSIVFNSLLEDDVFILHFNTSKPVKNGHNHEYRLYDINDNLLRIAKVNFLESDSTDFHLEVANLPCLPVKFKLWFYGILCIEEIIG
ncbi:MAG: DarT ssDNA thymidine ADP-ribosyltransferase family protein [Sedimentibacter sp.]